LDIQQSIDLIKSIFPGSNVVGTEAAEPLPFVLEEYLNNLHARETKRDLEQKLGIYQADEIERDFLDMVRRVTGLELCFESAGESKTVPVKSRWNGEYAYQKAVYRKLRNQVKGLKATTLLTLTFKPEWVKAAMPDWWTEPPKTWLIRYGNQYLSAFLKRLRSHMMRRGLKWNFICSFMDFHDSEETAPDHRGYLHYHLLFYGSWIAEIDEIVKLWGFAERQGVNVKRLKGYSAVAYVTNYVKKGMAYLRLPAQTDLAKWLWYFRVRLYNCRHFMKHKSEDFEEVVEADKGKWVCVGFSILGRIVPFKRFTNRECRDFYT